MKFFFYFICLLYILSPANSEESYSKDIKNYFNGITIFKSEFYHIENSEISLGNLYFNEDRLRIEYLSPQNLLFVLKNKKVMFFNKELMEVQYFNPKNTPAQIIIDIFNNKDFFNDFNISEMPQQLLIEKEILIEDEIHKLTVFFEISPISIRKIKISGEISSFEFALLNIDYNPNFEKSIFSLANPLLN
tara:strand:+ start:834 stop:1403 length:570 start_codon:yes stop_codon:yes gene_type:complete